MYYDLHPQYLPGKLIHITDFLSGTHIKGPVEKDEEVLCEMVHSVSRHISINEKRETELRRESAADPVLMEVLRFVNTRWHHKESNVPVWCQLFWCIQSDLYEEYGLLFHEDQIVVPMKLQEQILQALHEGRFGIGKTIGRARIMFVWPGISSDIEKYMTECKVCEKYIMSNRKALLIPHPIPTLPFQKVGADLLEFAIKNYLVVYDYLSKWLKIVSLPNIQSNRILDALKSIFSTHGIPRVTVTDTMPFNSYEPEHEFEFHMLSSHRHQSNGTAKKGVGIAKSILRKSKEEYWLALMEYRNTPIIGLGKAPAQILMSRLVRTRLPVSTNNLIPKVALHMKSKQELQLKVKSHYGKKATWKTPEFQKGQSVVVQKGKVWEEARILGKHKAPRSYIITDESGKIARRNTKFLRPSSRKVQQEAVGHVGSDPRDGETSLNECSEVTEWMPEQQQ
ncbi:hypothetical protein PR048_008905 [Dryococelus australis]|uniref:RNA-directed DNA polymerase n=1 Tax=Dryococelus australis TaxID=614101 RepID=A0ABQ9HYE9_9NEOP|nr:hypothetical protein PR048_008905 [Dryococelus australis]